MVYYGMMNQISEQKFLEKVEEFMGGVYDAVAYVLPVVHRVTMQRTNPKLPRSEPYRWNPGDGRQFVGVVPKPTRYAEVISTGSVRDRPEVVTVIGETYAEEALSMVDQKARVVDLIMWATSAETKKKWLRVRASIPKDSFYGSVLCTLLDMDEARDEFFFQNKYVWGFMLNFMLYSYKRDSQNLIELPYNYEYADWMGDQVPLREILKILGALDPSGLDRDDKRLTALVKFSCRNKKLTRADLAEADSYWEYLSMNRTLTDDLVLSAPAGDWFMLEYNPRISPETLALIGYVPDEHALLDNVKALWGRRVECLADVVGVWCIDPLVNYLAENMVVYRFKVAHALLKAIPRASKGLLMLVTGFL